MPEPIYLTSEIRRIEAAAKDLALMQRAGAAAAELAARKLATNVTRIGNVRLLATDSPERFARVGARFLGSSIAERTVETIDL